MTKNDNFTQFELISANRFHNFTKSQTRLSDFTFTFDLLYWLLLVVDLQIFHVAFSTMVTFTPLGKEQCRKKVMPNIVYMGFSTWHQW